MTPEVTPVEFLHDCGDDRAGERKAIDAKRAKRLAWTGYARILDPKEGAMADGGAEKAIAGRSGKPERRG